METSALHAIRLASGRYIDLSDPSPEDIDIGDIAAALSKICRFGAQVGRFYSVAEHCVHCQQVAREDGLPIKGQLAVLLHDAAEAYVGDMAKPLKLLLPEFSRVERLSETAIEIALNVDFGEWKHAIREIDVAMLMAEKRQLFSADNVLWRGEAESRRIERHVECWEPREAERRFLEVYSGLTK